MYSMLIVDDNPLDRKNVAAFLDWRSIGIEVAGAFMNGKPVLEQLDRLKPDIILTDIQMPVVGGLELAEQVKQRYPDTSIIFMSSYDEFDYARFAVRFEIEDYVLKPIVKDELARTMRKTVQKLEEKERRRREREGMLDQLRKSLTLYQEQLLRDVIFGYVAEEKNIHARMELLDIDLPAMACLQVLVLRIVDPEDRQASSTAGLDISGPYHTAYSIKKQVQAIHRSFGDGGKLYVVQLSDREFVLIAGRSGGRLEEEQRLLDEAIALKEQIQERLGLLTILGISPPAGTVSALPALYKKALEAAHTKYYSRNAQVIHYSDIAEHRPSVGDVLDFQQTYKDVKRLLLEADASEIGPFVQGCLDESAISLTPSYVEALTLSVRNAVQIVLLENGKTFNPQDRSAAYGKDHGLISMLSEAKELLQASHKPQYERIVDDIRRIISQRYAEQITVNDIANSIFISPSHANYIFKSKTGRTIFDDLIEYRVEMAKKKLREPGSRVYLVAQEVGYTNKSHFCLLFKKVTGYTPMEYKNGAGS